MHQHMQSHAILANASIMPHGKGTEAAGNQQASTCADMSQEYHSPDSPAPAASASAVTSSKREVDKSRFGKFVLGLRTKNVPKKNCDEIVEEFKKFSVDVVSDVRDQLCPDHQGEVDVDVKALPSVAPLYRIDNNIKQDYFARKKLLMVPPETRTLPSDDGKRRTFQFVPVTKQVESVLKIKNFREAVLSDSAQHEERESIYHDICDGSLHSREDHNEKLKIILYCDDFTVSCPVGNKTVKYNILGVYFAIGNLPTRSRLDNIYLTTLIHKAHIKKISWDVIL